MVRCDYTRTLALQIAYLNTKKSRLAVAESGYLYCQMDGERSRYLGNHFGPRFCISDHLSRIRQNKWGLHLTTKHVQILNQIAKVI